MKYLWDTDTAIYFLNGNRKVIEAVERAGQESVAITAVTVCELKYGAYRSSRVEENLRRIDLLRERITVLSDVTVDIASFYAKTKAALKAKGWTVGDFDLLIAAFAVVKGLVLVTNNTSHYHHIEGLALENWSA